MKRFIVVLACVAAQAATITLNESVLLNTSPTRIGVNVSTSTYYDSGQLYKNLLFSVNPGFEGVIQQEIVGCISGSATTCVNYYKWDQAPSNYWAGATAYFCCSASASSSNLGQTRTISSSTTNSATTGPTYTFSSPLPQPVAADDYFSVKNQIDSTGSVIPQWLLSGAATGETTNIPPGSAGVQGLSLPAGACAAAYADTTGTHDFIILQTGQTFGFNLKTVAISGSPLIKVSVARLGGKGGGASPSSAILMPGSEWATQSLSFSGAESTGTVYGDLQVQLCNSGTGTAYVDDADLERSSNLNASNTSAYRDEVVSSLTAIHPGSLRLWDYQLGETLADWTNPLYGRHVQSSLQGQTYVSATSGRNAGGTAQGLLEFLSLCELMGTNAWITIPTSWPISDYSNLIDFLAGAGNTSYGAKRIANGHTAPYTATLGNIYIEFGNEPWNSVFAGINMPNFSYATTHNGMLSYGHWSGSAMSAMKANPNFSSTLKLIVNMQAASNYEFTNHVVPNNSYLDAVSIAPYIGGGQFDSAGTLDAEWNPDTAFTWGDSNDAKGDSGNGWTYAYVAIKTVPVYVYEDSENQIAGTVPVATLQNHSSSFMAGTVVAQQMLEHLRILGPNAPQHIWSLAQDQFKNASSVSIPLWGIMKEAGGEWAGTGNYVQRPIALATQIANDSIIGPEYSSTVTSPDTYSTGASNGIASESNVPYEFTYCFMSNSNRSCVLVNTDPSNSHIFTFTGTNVPASVTTRVLSMAGETIDTCNNESSAPCVGLVTTNGVPVSGGAITVAPGTIEGIDFVAGGGSTTTAPVISNVISGGVTGTSAVISWTTDQSATAQVDYGTTAAYGSLSTSNPSLATSHSVTLAGLIPGSNYNYAAISVNSAGQLSTSANFTFSTPATVTTPVISSVTSSTITSTSATVTWATNLASSSQVEYGTTPSYGSPSVLSLTPVTSHSVTLTGLTAGTTYDYAVISGDSAGSATSANFTLSTQSTVIVPVISAVTSSGITATSATVAWTTGQAASSQVQFGTTMSYGSFSSLSSTPVTSHSVTLTGLNPGTTYNYAVLSLDSAGTASSGNFTFATSASTSMPAMTHIGGAHNNTGNSGSPASLSITYASGNGNTLVAVCALGNTASSIGSITDSGSLWARQAYVVNGSSVRSEIWSTGADGSVASKSFTVNMSSGSPMSCGVEEYAGVRILGATATNQGAAGTTSVSVTTQEANDYVVAGLGADSYDGFTATSGVLRQSGGLASNLDGNHVEMTLCDNTGAAATSVKCTAVSGSAAFADVALVLR